MKYEVGTAIDVKIFVPNFIKIGQIFRRFQWMKGLGCHKYLYFLKKGNYGKNRHTEVTFNLSKRTHCNYLGKFALFYKTTQSNTWQCLSENAEWNPFRNTATTDAITGPVFLVTVRI
jgi:outer membrane phospholipase A